jgi:hypothetical protein
MEVDESFRDLVTGRVAPLLKGVVPSTIRREDCCPTADCVSPGGLPIVDAPVEGPNGLVVAVSPGGGWWGAPAPGWRVPALGPGAPTPFPIEAFGLDRFEDRSADFEYRSHWD